MFRSVCFVACLLSALPLHAEEPATPEARQKHAVIDIKKVDSDFAYQGEYVGKVDGERTGLQVIAFGAGKFEALVLAGGLPGAGWNGENQWRMTGQRSGNQLVFSRNSYVGDEETKTETTLTYQVAGKTVNVQSADGRSQGSLKKTKRTSPTLGATPPWGAVKLFDGDDLWQFQGGQITEEGWLAAGTEMKHAYQDFLMHVEFRLPYMPYATGQARSNSGCYLQSRYEVQILDSFGLDLEFNHCGSLYRYKEPDLNMCLPPLQWQTYEIKFQAARFNDKKEKVKNASITVWHNGVKIHDNFELERKTGAGKQEGAEALATKFQDHSNPVRFQNMWIIDLNSPIPAPAAHPDFRPWTPDSALLQK